MKEDDPDLYESAEKEVKEKNEAEHINIRERN